MASNPTGANRFGVQTPGFGVGYLFVLAFLDGRAVKVVFAVGEPETYALNVAFEANCAPSGELWRIKIC